MGRLTDVELEGMPEQGHRMIALVEGVVSTIEGCKGSSVLLSLECPWVVLALGEARHRPMSEVLASVRDDSLKWAAHD